MNPHKLLLKTNERGCLKYKENVNLKMRRYYVKIKIKDKLKDSQLRESWPEWRRK